MYQEHGVDQAKMDTIHTSAQRALKAWKKQVQTYLTLATSLKWLSSQCHQDTFLISSSQNPTSRLPKYESSWIKQEDSWAAKPTWSFGLGLSESKSIS